MAKVGMGLRREAGLRSEVPAGSLALLSERHLGNGKGKKAKVLWVCSMLSYGVLLMKRNRRIFKDYRGVGMEKFCNRVKFWQIFLASASETSISHILLDCRATVV